MKTDNKDSVPTVKGLDANEVPTLKGTETEEVKEEAKVDSPIGQSEVVEPTPEAAKNTVEVNKAAFNINEMPKTSSQTSAIDPLAAPTVSSATQSTFDPTAMPTTSSSGAFDPTAVPTGSTPQAGGNSKLPLIIGIVAAALVVVGIIVTIIANSGNKLKCVSKEEYGMQYTYIMKFDSDNKIKSMVVEETIDVSEEFEGMSEAEINEGIEELRETLKDTADNIKVTRNGNKINISMNMKSVSTFGTKKEDIKKRLEDREFTCK